MKKVILGAILALIVFMVLLLALAPAKVATPLISDIVPGVSFSGVKGSVWSFQAETIHYQKYAINDVTLNTNPLALLMGSLQSDLKVDDENAKLSADLSLGQDNFEFSKVAYDIDVSYIVDNLNTAIEGAKGQLSGTIDTAHIKNNKLLALQGVGQWNNALIEYPNNNLDLGNIKFELTKATQSDNTLRLQIIENQGVLDLRGYIELSLDKSFTMKLHSSSSLPPNLKSWLTRWGRTQGDRIYLEWRGKLP